MSATIIDGKEVAARVRAEVARDVAAFASARADARAGHDPGRRRSGVGGLRANKRKAWAEVGIADYHQHLPSDATQDDVAAVIEDVQRQPGGERDPAPAARARRAERQGADRADLAGQGRRRPDPRQRRPAHAGRARPAAVHAARRDRAARPLLGRARGGRGGRRGALGPGRQAGGVPAARAQRHRDHVPFAHARSAGVCAAGRRADRRDRAARDDRRRTTSSRARR